MASRRAALAGPLALLAGCATDPLGEYLFGFGDPVRGAALNAPRSFGDTGRWAGRPAEAALAAERLEFLTSQLPLNPRYAAVNPATLQQLQRARAEMRDYLGIPAAAEPEVVIAGLRRAAAALRDGSRASAEAALASPAFAAGPAATLDRLAAMPRLPRTAEAAGAVAAEIGRLDQRR